MTSVTSEQTSPKWLLTARRWARAAGWGALASAGMIVVTAVAGWPELLSGAFVVLALLLAGLFLLVEWGLALLVVSRLEPGGLASLGYALIRKRELVYEGRWVRALGAAWMIIGVACLLLAVTATGSMVLDRMGPTGIRPRTGEAVRWQHYELQVPRGSVVHQNDSEGLVLIVNPRARTARRLELHAFAGPTGNYDDEAAVQTSGWIGWRLRTRGGGSGGTEAEACGRLMNAGVDLGFCCTDQSELGPDPTWCLPWLASVRER